MIDINRFEFLRFKFAGNSGLEGNSYKYEEDDCPKVWSIKPNYSPNCALGALGEGLGFCSLSTSYSGSSWGSLCSALWRSTNWALFFSKRMRVAADRPEPMGWPSRFVCSSLSELSSSELSELSERLPSTEINGYLTRFWFLGCHLLKSMVI